MKVPVVLCATEQRAPTYHSFGSEPPRPVVHLRMRARVPDRAVASASQVRLAAALCLLAPVSLDGAGARTPSAPRSRPGPPTSSRAAGAPRRWRPSCRAGGRWSRCARRRRWRPPACTSSARWRRSRARSPPARSAWTRASRSRRTSWTSTATIPPAPPGRCSRSPSGSRRDSPRNGAGVGRRPWWRARRREGPMARRQREPRGPG